MRRYLPTYDLATRYREQAVDFAGHRVLLTNFAGTQQEGDLTERPNCRGFGRIRHFNRKKTNSWVDNPLPIDPAAKALGCPPTDQLRVQVFQNAVCNWRCWYCFVPFTLLDANKQHSSMMTCRELIQLWLAEPNRPHVIDLTGGQPELVPEWVLWMMHELREANVERTVYLWSDDNLSGDYFWDALSSEDRKFITSYPKYGRVCCFKGFNEDSFCFNTTAPPEEHSRQFERMGKLIATGLDLYGYVTLTTPHTKDLNDQISRFVDELQELDENLPLRTVPLEIDTFIPTAFRMNEQRKTALDNQYRALDAWQRIVESRFSTEMRSSHICDVPLWGKVRHVSL